MTHPEDEGLPFEEVPREAPRPDDIPPVREEAHTHRRHRRDESPVLAWARAVALGLRDTAHAVVDEGRKGARRAYDEGWREYEAKTKHRRHKD